MGTERRASWQGEEAAEEATAEATAEATEEATEEATVEATEATEATGGEQQPRATGGRGSLGGRGPSARPAGPCFSSVVRRADGESVGAEPAGGEVLGVESREPRPPVRLRAAAVPVVVAGGASVSFGAR